MIGNIVAAIVIVVLTACFPQDRIAFLGLLALWCGICAFVSTLLRNFASYAAALSGYTTAIIASELLGATGGGSAASSYWRSRAPVRSAWGLRVPASFSPGPISAVPADGWSRCWPIWDSRSRADLPAC